MSGSLKEYLGEYDTVMLGSREVFSSVSFGANRPSPRPSIILQPFVKADPQPEGGETVYVPKGDIEDWIPADLDGEGLKHWAYVPEDEV